MTIACVHRDIAAAVGEILAERDIQVLLAAIRNFSRRQVEAAGAHDRTNCFIVVVVLREADLRIGPEAVEIILQDEIDDARQRI